MKKESIWCDHCGIKAEPKFHKGRALIVGLGGISYGVLGVYAFKDWVYGVNGWTKQDLGELCPKCSKKYEQLKLKHKAEIKKFFEVVNNE